MDIKVSDDNDDDEDIQIPVIVYCMQCTSKHVTTI